MTGVINRKQVRAGPQGSMVSSSWTNTEINTSPSGLFRGGSLHDADSEHRGGPRSLPALAI
jgi:hypothetical protein